MRIRRRFSFRSRFEVRGSRERQRPTTEILAELRMTVRWMTFPRSQWRRTWGTRFCGRRGWVPELRQVSCYIAQTTPETLRLIRENAHRSPMYTGQISAIGPRYCPSIEDKIVRFPEKTQHQFFLEPEGLNTHEVYVNGMSTSLPMEVQAAMVRSIPGLENAEMLRPGYAIEYDAIDPTELDRTLRVKKYRRAVSGGADQWDERV